MTDVNKPRLRASSQNTPAESNAGPAYGTYAPSLISRLGITLGRCLPAGKLGLRAAGAIKPIAMVGLKDGQVDVEVFDLRLRLHPKDNLSEKRMFLTPQCFNAAELAAVRTAMSPGKTFIDIGSNSGAYALIAAQAGGPSSKVLAVEPQREMRKRLLFNARENGLENIEVTGVAVSDYDGEGLLRLVDSNLGEVRLDKGGSGDAVKVSTLVSLMDHARITKADVIKIDVEGEETRILTHFFNNAEATRWPQMLIIERPDLGGANHANTTALAISNGYEIKETTRQNVILVRK